jgi:hypothetical protein
MRTIKTVTLVIFSFAFPLAPFVAPIHAEEIDGKFSALKVVPNTVYPIISKSDC